MYIHKYPGQPNKRTMSATNPKLYEKVLKIRLQSCGETHLTTTHELFKR